MHDVTVQISSLVTSMLTLTNANPTCVDHEGAEPKQWTKRLEMTVTLTIALPRCTPCYIAARCASLSCCLADAPMPTAGPARDATVVSAQVLMHTVGIRRTKATRVNGRPLVELPPRELRDVPITLDKATRAVYDAWSTAGLLQTVHGSLCRVGGRITSYPCKADRRCLRRI